MAKSQYEYVKQFELSDVCLPHTWLMCRIDGVGFTKFTASHKLVKPNDDRARDVMNAAARAVMNEYTDICIAYGVSDEYSFVLQPMTDLYSRRASKISSAIVSLFTSAYVANWNNFFLDSPLQLNNLPFFDSRLVCYPTDSVIKDYLRWRQVDCHINNLYNTAFWKLVRRYEERNPEWSEKQARDLAHAEMNTTYASSGQKNDLLHDEFGINYNEECAAYRKGSIFVWTETTDETKAPAETASTACASSSSSPRSIAPTRSLSLLHCDLIQESFYTDVCPGTIPFISWSEMKKQRKAAQKADRKAEHKRREQEERRQKAAERAVGKQISETEAKDTAEENPVPAN